MISGTNGTTLPGGFGVEIQAADSMRDDFLRLLTVQLANQDPLSPMDNNAMVEQLATFSQLEQLEGINNRLEQSMQYTQSLNNTMMMDVVGKRVTVLGDGVQLENGESSRSLVRASATGVADVRVYDQDGALVRTIEGVVLDGGFNEIEWDGRNDSGELLEDGDYRLEVDAVSPSGQPIGAVLFQSGIVDTVQFDNNVLTLIVNGQKYTPAEVVEVGMAPSNTAPDDTPVEDTGDVNNAPWESLGRLVLS